MKKYFILYKPFLLFLGKFLLVYLLLTVVYEKYLSHFDSKKSELDGFTHIVANQTVYSLTIFHLDCKQVPSTRQPSIKIAFKDRFVARIIEGCNGLSVIILFIAFVVAFTGKWSQTLLFCVFGSLLIHFLNVFRIAVLCVLMFYFPEYQPVLHDVIFPLFIYSIVFGLWVIWVNYFSLYAKKNTTK